MSTLADALALAFLAGPWDSAALAERGAEVVGARPRWLRAVVKTVLGEFPIAPQVDHVAAVAEVVRAAASFPCAAPITARRWFTPEASMRPRHGWNVPPLATSGDLAAWLGVTPSQLDGFADLGGYHRTTNDARLRHHRVRWIAKPSGGWRALEAPKDRLKTLQRRVLDGILAHIPPHPAAHGFVHGRSAITHARAHVGRSVVVRLDVADFFTAVHATLVRAIFREAGYPDAVAARLAGLCTTRMSRDDWRGRPADVTADALWRRLREPHLAQGAPTSPALANLALWPLDRRLAALAIAFGATYTRYADDLTFSADGALDRLPARVAAIAEDEGFPVRPNKTRTMTAAARQRVAGLVVNERPNVPRDDYDRLRATLHRCATRGVAAAEVDAPGDLRAHLLGRVAWVAATSPGRAEKLQRLVDRIVW